MACHHLMRMGFYYHKNSYMLKILTYTIVVATVALASLQVTSTEKNIISKSRGPVIKWVSRDSGSAEANYKNYCSGCHGEKMDAFVDREWKHGSSREDIFKGTKHGYIDGGMPSFDSAFTNEEIYALADYILSGIKNLKRYQFNDAPVAGNLFVSEDQNIQLDTVVKGIASPWAIAFCPMMKCW